MNERSFDPGPGPGPTGSPVLTARGLDKTYVLASRRLEVLKALDLSITEGEIVAVVGRSGAGKSTLLHLLGGLDTPDAGEIHFRGEDVVHLGDEARARYRNQSVGFVFQFHHLLPEFTARENVQMPLLLGGDVAGAGARTDALLEAVGLAERAHHAPAQLSGGERQRVAVARALANDPDVLLADEPSGNLDLETGAKIYDLIFDLRRRLGHSVVVSTHSRELAERSDRILELRDGRVHPIR